MKMRISLSLALTAVLLLPALAAAAPPTSAPAGCSQQLATPAAPDAGAAPALQEALALSPLDGALAMAGCCDSLLHQCEANCRHKGGINEFNCFPDNCTASCICNVFP